MQQSQDMTRSGHTLLIGALMALITLLTSCVTAGPSAEELAAASLGISSTPQVAMLYYPYGPALAHETAEPHPNYTSWPQHRMRLDLRRMSRAGIDLVAVHVDAAETLRQNLAVQYRAFAETADALGTGYVLYVDATGLVAGQEQALVQWLLGLNLPTVQSYWKDAGRPIVILTGSEALGEVRHIGLDIRRWSWQPAPRLKQQARLPMPQLAAESAVLRIHAGWGRAVVKDDERSVHWEVSRNEGRLLARSLWKAWHLQPGMILIDSWNDYANGTFVEPNSYDGEAVLQALTDALVELKSPRGESQ